MNVSPEWIAKFSLVFGSIAAFMAKNRGKNPYLWFFLGLFFGIYSLVFLFFSDSSGRKAKKRANDPIDVTPVFDTTFQDKLWYYLEPDRTQLGPMSFDALKKSYTQGKISKKTFVWNEGLKDWKPLSDFLKNS